MKPTNRQTREPTDLSSRADDSLASGSGGQVRGPAPGWRDNIPRSHRWGNVIRLLSHPTVTTQSLPVFTVDPLPDGRPLIVRGVLAGVVIAVALLLHFWLCGGRGKEPGRQRSGSCHSHPDQWWVCLLCCSVCLRSAAPLFIQGFRADSAITGACKLQWPLPLVRHCHGSAPTENINERRRGIIRSKLTHDTPTATSVDRFSTKTSQNMTGCNSHWVSHL